MKNLTLTNLFGELSNEIANKLHLLQKQTDNNEPANVKCKVKSYVSFMTYIIYKESWYEIWYWTKSSDFWNLA